MILYIVVGINNIKKNRVVLSKGAKVRRNAFQFEVRYIFCMILYIIVGIGMTYKIG